MERNYIVNQTKLGIFRLSSTFWLSGIYLMDEYFFVNQLSIQVAQARMIRPGINTVYVNVCLCYAIGEMSGFVWEYTVTLLTQKSGLFLNKTRLTSLLCLFLSML